MKTITFIRTALIAVIMLFATIVSGWAASIASLELGTASQSGNTTGAATFTTKDAGVNALPALTLTSGQQGQAGGAGYIGSKVWNTTGINTAAYWQFTITAASGKTIDVSSIALRMYRSSTGAASIALRSDADYTSNIGGVQSLPSATNTTITFSSLALTGKSAITFRVYGYGGSASAGTLRIGDGTASSLDVDVQGVVNSATSPVITASQSYTPTVGVPFSQQIGASNSPTSFALASGSVLPAGLSMSTGGLVTGTPTAAGSSSPSINATNGSGTSPDVAVGFTVGKGTQSVTFGVLSSKYTTDGDYTISATASSGLGVTFSSSLPGVATVTGTTVHIVGAGMTTITAAQAGDANWNAATSVDRTLTVTVPAAPQTITFNALSHGTYGSSYADLSASSTSGLSVSFASSNSTVATVTTGGVVTVVGPGTTTITATQAGNVSYNAATPVTQDLVVDVKPLTVTSPAVTSKTYDGLLAATITGSITGQLVGSDVVTLGGTGVFADVNVNTGIAVTPTYTLGGANAAKYSITQPTGMTGDITIASQTITFNTPIPAKLTTDAPFTVTATASSGLTVAFSSSNTSVATVLGSTVTIVGAGTATIYATQSGDGNYNAAPAGQNQALSVTYPAPVAAAASHLTGSSMYANWGTVAGATGYVLDVYTKSSGSPVTVSEGFDAGITAPANWTFTAIQSGSTYTSAGNYGASSPSLKLDATGDAIQTPTLASAATQMSFWLKGQTTTGSLLVEGYNGASWVTIENIVNPSNTAATHTYNSGSTPALPSSIVQFRYTYTKTLSNLSFDDVSYTYSSLTTTPISGSPFSVSGGSSVDYYLSGLALGTYYYTVKATDGTNTSAASSEITATLDILTNVNTPSSSAKIMASKGQLTVSGVSEFTVYNAQGVEVAIVKAANDYTSVALRSGIYFVKVAGKTQKVLVK
jgi:hypothetical protein